MADDNRELLIELRADMRHVREGIDHIRSSDARQWEKIDSCNGKLEGHEKSIGHLTWGFRTIAGGVVTILVGIVVWSLTH